MIDTAAAFSAECEIERSNPQVIDEDGVIGARSESFDAQIGALPDLLPGLRSGGSGETVQLAALPCRNVLFRIVDIARHAVNELLERVRAGHGQVAAAVAVAV